MLNAGQAQIPSYCLTPGDGVLCTQVLASGNTQPTPIPLTCSRVADKGSTPEGGTTPCVEVPCFAAKEIGNSYFTWQGAHYPTLVQEGLTYRFMQTREQAQAQPDSKHPSALTLLTDALRLADVQTDGGSSGSGGGSGGSLTMIIGHRHRDGDGPGCFKTITKTERVPAGSDDE